VDRRQLLLIKLAEEGGEVAKIALMAAIEMLNEECGLDYTPNPDRIKAKKAKVDKFAAYSVRIGMVAATQDHR
jgi:hypothetical protein